MQYLKQSLYRISGSNAPVPRDAVNYLLDRGHIECAMAHGRWWRIRRNGKTQTWKRDANRIRIPFKMGLYGHGAITEADFEER
jgi:hypothetical protein